MSDKLHILRLYKEILRESSKFNSYYYRNYFTRKAKNQFRKHIVADEETALHMVKKSEDMLALLRRQTVVTNAFSDTKLVIEKQQSNHKQQPQGL